MNFYDYIYLEQLLEITSSDLTVKLPTNIKNYLDDNYVKEPILTLANTKDSIYVGECLSGNITLINNVPYFNKVKSSPFDIMSGYYYTLSYEMRGSFGETQVIFKDSYNESNLDTSSLVFHDSSQLSEWNTYTHIIKVPDEASQLQFSLDSTGTYKNISLREGVPQTIKDRTPVWSMSNLCYKYLTSISSIDIDFSNPSSSSLINKTRSLGIYTQNRALFYLTQLCYAELLALNYYQKEDSSYFRYLSMSDFKRVQHNLSLLKHFLSTRGDYSSILLNIDNLLVALGYYETAFATKTTDLNFHE